jgi:hypothetical protein
MPGPDDFDPMQGLDAEDLAYLQRQREAFSRQKAAHQRFALSDEDRRKAAEEHMRATQAANGVVPQEAPVPVAAPAVTAPAPVAAPRPTPSGLLSILVAIPEAAGAGGIPPTTEKYAGDWETLKGIIAKYDGTWVVVRHEFPANVPDILGFFGKDGWTKPSDSEKQRFEAIVKSGRVFKTD